MNDLYEKILEKLKDARRIAFLGIGEEKLGDDGVGPYIISKLLYLSNNRFFFINAATDPMSRIDDITNIQPSHLVLIDTCTLNTSPGTISILERDRIREYVPISTHTIPIHVVIDLLIEKLPNLNVFMIGFVPESLEGFHNLNLHPDRTLDLENINKNIELPFFEINLSKTIQLAADQLIEIIRDIIYEL